MCHPAFHVPKTYEFMALGTLDAQKINQLSEGVTLIGANQPTQGAEVTVTGQTILSEISSSLHPDMQVKLSHNLPGHPVVRGLITIREGKKRQIRRMLKVVGCCVIYLKRISIGDIVLDPELKPGEYREWHMGI